MWYPGKQHNSSEIKRQFYYQYDSPHAGPHAVTQANGLDYEYDSVGNMTRARVTGAQANTDAERAIEWTAFNKPSKITRNGKWAEFTYDANHNRYLKTSSDAGV